MMQSDHFASDFNLTYTEKTETNISKLFRACVRDHQSQLVVYMLRNNPTLFNLRLTAPNGEGSYDAFEYA